MKKAVILLIAFMCFFACENSSDSGSSLSGTISAKIAVDKTKFLPTEAVVFDGETSVFIDGASEEKIYEWTCTNEVGESAKFEDKGSSITLLDTKAGRYQVSLCIKQGNLTSQVAKKTIYRIDSEEVYVRVKVSLPEGTDAAYLAHTGGYDMEIGNPINTVGVTGDDWVPYATLLTEQDKTTGEYLYKDGDFFYRDYIVTAADIFDIQPTQGSWGSKARKGNGSSDFNYRFFPCFGTAENPTVVELTCVTRATQTNTEFHWGFNSASKVTQRSPLLVFGDKANSFKLLYDMPDANGQVTFGEEGQEGKVINAERDIIDGEESGYCAVFDNLEAGKTYYYKFSDDDPVYFKAPAHEAVEFTFAACSDHQLDNDNIKSGTEAMARQKPAFIISCGDITNDGFSAEEWKSRFFDILVPGIAGISFASAPGNHDGQNLFNEFLGQENRYHSFVYGNARFIMLDVENAYSPDTQQYKWLEDILENDKSTWKIVALHENPYCCVPRHYSNLLVRKNLVPLFEKYGVNLVLGGHMHAYDRTKPVNGIQYVTLPCMGASTSEGTVYEDEDFYLKSELGKQGFASITVTSDLITVKVQTNTGGRIDEFSIDTAGNITEL